MIRRALSLLAVALSGAAAQSVPAPRPSATLVGFAYDSLHAAPLAGAFVSLTGTGFSTTSDANGAFRFEQLAPGAYTVVVLHAALDSIGVSGLAAYADTRRGDDTVHLAVPSFATLWRVACGPAPAPRDSGFVFGSVHDAVTHRPVGGARVGVSWIDFSIDRRLDVAAQRWGGESPTDSTGSYAVCGVPAGATLHVVATKGSAATGVIDIFTTRARVTRRDLFIPPADSTSLHRGGIVVGLVRDKSGGPIAGARAMTAGADEARSGTDGRFVLRGVPLGTRQIEVTSIGAAPAAAVVDVSPNDTATVSLELQPVVALQAMTVHATSSAQRRLSEIADRRRLGFGHVMDSTRVGHFAFLNNAIAMLTGSYCQLFIDGRRTDRSELKFRDPYDVALIETLLDFETPFAWRPKAPCTTVLIWTKNTLR